MKISARDLVRRVAVQLVDEGNVNWSEPELAAWLQEGVNALAQLRPDLFTRTTEVEVEQGAAKQQLPEKATRVTRVLTVRRGEDGVPQALTRFDPVTLSAISPNWYAVKGRPRQFATTADQTRFWLYPIPDRSDYRAEVEAVVVPEIPTPAEWADEEADDTFEVDSRFERALVDYMLYRALDKDSDGSSPERAQARYQAFHDAAFDTFYPPPREAQEQMQRQQEQAANQRER